MTSSSSSSSEHTLDFLYSVGYGGGCRLPVEILNRYQTRFPNRKPLDEYLTLRKHHHIRTDPDVIQVIQEVKQEINSFSYPIQETLLSLRISSFPIDSRIPLELVRKCLIISEYDGCEYPSLNRNKLIVEWIKQHPRQVTSQVHQLLELSKGLDPHGHHESDEEEEEEKPIGLAGMFVIPCTAIDSPFPEEEEKKGQPRGFRERVQASLPQRGFCVGCNTLLYGRIPEGTGFDYCVCCYTRQRMFMAGM